MTARELEAGTDSAAILVELESASGEARADERAAELLEGEAEEMSPDEIIAAEATISAWIK
ncbi:MAG: hypothetical protein CEE40_05380 [Chloroflexi bacterium B3_Chlor]|nr:MAG: hypothetical protein CEE40_05380 [Chloroflexi bacterium B3_Chlor]